MLQRGEEIMPERNQETLEVRGQELGKIWKPVKGASIP